MFRLAIPILMMLMPQFLPRIVRYFTLVWRLSCDKRVSIFVRSLVPLALVYFVIPTDFVKDQVPIVGRFDDIIVLGMALLLLVKLSPRHIVDEHLGVGPVSNRPEDQDPTNVVDGASRIIDE